MALQYFTLVHVFISLLGIAAGFGVLAGLINSKLLPWWTAVFLVTTAATSITGFFFPFNGITPGIVLGIISVIALAAGAYGLYFGKLAGGWRMTFVITSVLSLYLNVLVLFVQLFQKMPALHELAPNGNELPFAVTQLIVLAAFLGLGIVAGRNFRGS